MTASRRWLSVPAVLVVLLVALVAVRYIALRRDVEAALGDELESPIRVGRMEIDAWRDALALRAQIAADLVQDNAATASRDTPINGSSFDRLARAVTATDSATLWLATPSGVVLRSSGARLASDSIATEDVSAAFATVRCGGAYCAEARRAITVNGERMIVGVRVPLGDRTFPRLDPPGRLRESRATLLARRGDSLVVLATAAHDSAPLLPGAIPWSRAPAHVREAFAGKSRRGAADNGLVHERVLFATASYPELGWVLVREIRGDALLKRLVGPVFGDVLFVMALLLLALAYLKSRMRVAAMRRSQELAAVRSNFVAAVSHELRTPLAQITLFADLLRKNSLRGPAEVERAWNVIEKESGRLAILVDNVLSHARLTRGEPERATPGEYATDVARDATHVVDAFAPLAAAKAVRIVRDIDVPVTAAVDSQALRQILLNFLENAVKYGPRGQTVMLGSAVIGEHVRVWVSDEGPGVPDVERETIWAPFERGMAARNSTEGGSGIGLSVVRDLVQRYGGRAWVERAPSGGARFVVEFAAAHGVPSLDHSFASGSEAERSV